MPRYLQALAAVRLKTSGFRRGPNFMFWVLFWAGALCSYCCVEGLIRKMLEGVCRFLRTRAELRSSGPSVAQQSLQIGSVLFSRYSAKRLRERGREGERETLALLFPQRMLDVLLCEARELRGQCDAFSSRCGWVGETKALHAMQRCCVVALHV